MEKLARHALRGPVATERLTGLEDGRLPYEFRHSWRDGTQAVLFEPMEFIERLVALIAVPRRNLVRHHGSLAPGSKLRARIVWAGPSQPARRRHAGCAEAEAGEGAIRRLSWAELMKRVLLVDVLECPRCSGRMEIVATITQPDVITAMLECIGLPARPPPLAPARPLVQPELDFGARPRPGAGPVPVALRYHGGSLPPGAREMPGDDSHPTRPAAGRSESARLERLSELVAAALALAAGERAAFLSKACAGDEELRREVEASLAGVDPASADTLASAVGREAAALLRDRRLEGSGARAGTVRRIGPYRIDGELGRGGMGVVYQAFDERLHRVVALKALPEDLVGDPGQLARLEREARALAAVNHPHVATIHGLEEDDSGSYLVLELVEGETLQARLRGGALPVEEARELCAQVAEGLAAVHRKGLVHRDLKPSNVMITPEGRAKLLDFGLARRATPEAGEELTAREVVAGTSGWMAPEQLRGELLDARSDAWAWGCLLFECVAGVPAFPGATWADRDAATLTLEPDWSRLPRELPVELRELVRQCLARDREARPESLAAIRARLADRRDHSAERGARPRHVLPAERDEFVGRAEDLRELGERLARGERLVEVLGIGGAGKTRLVLRLARERLADWPGGAWFCDLSEARSAEGIVEAVGRTLDVPLGAGDGVAALARAIAERGRCLIVLDNFEQVGRHAPETLGRWLDDCPQAQFLVTSRELLELPGESSFVLAPLEADDAVELFLRRARAAKRGFEVSLQERGTVLRLVRLLDGLPLAVEIAAARVSLMSPAKILERAADRFRLLSGGAGRHDRQATLRATLDWSWELLSEDERAALAQLSVFEGGFTLEAVEEVLELEALWPVDALQALVNKSLVRQVSENRFDLLVSVQEYAASRLEETGEVEAAQRRHGAWAAGFGTPEAVDRLSEHGGAERRRALVPELDNVVAACRRAVRRGDGPVAVDALNAAWALLQVRGPLSAGGELALEVLGLEDLSPVERARAAATGARSLGVGSRRVGEARALYEEAAALYREAGEVGGEVATLVALGALEVGQGLHDEAEPRFERALALHRQRGDRRGEGELLERTAVLAAARGRREEARALNKQALAIHREVGNRRSEGIVLLNLADLYSGERDLDTALRLDEEALRTFREIGERRLEGVVLGNLGAIQVLRGRRAEGAGLFEQAIAVHREVGNPRSEGIVLSNLALALFDEGRRQEARAACEEALAIHREVGNRMFEGIVLASLGRLELAEGRAAESGEALEQALAVHRELRLGRWQGVVLGDLGAVHSSAGRAEEAAACFAEGAELLGEAGDPAELARLLAARGLHALAGGEPDSALADQEEAEALALEVSEAGRVPFQALLGELRAALAAGG